MPFNLADVGQLTVGTMLGLALSFNMSRHGLSLRNPETRWKSIGIILLFLFSFLILSDLLLSLQRST